MKRISLEINGKKITKELPDHTTLSTLLRDVLNLKGFDARINHINRDNSRLYAVLEGRYPSKEAAQLVGNNIKKNLSYDSIIKKHE